MSAAVRDQRFAWFCDRRSLPRLPDHRQRFLTIAKLQDRGRLMILVLGLCGQLPRSAYARSI